jgi:hypothetical protein
MKATVKNVRRHHTYWAMRYLYFSSFVLLLVAVASARDSKDYLFPESLDAPAIVKIFLAEETKPGFIFSDLASAKFVSAHALLFRARVDNRPVVVEECLLCAQLEIGGKREWWLISFYRDPYGPRVIHAKWQVGFQSGIHSPPALRRVTTSPKAGEVQYFLKWAGWDSERYRDFRDVCYLSFPGAWKTVTGASPPAFKGATLWPPKD